MWRPTPDKSYPVIAIRDFSSDGQHVDIEADMPSGVEYMAWVPMRDIHPRPRSIVRALTADFTDHSRADRCQCGSAQAAHQLSQEPAQSVPVATQSFGLTGGGEAGADPNFQK
ncbi:DUF7324 family protein [Gordonia rubripertincta]|uniref:DUF7324 family protein n=1 Tax=Gordonia rubripertincta TaxID=36822 RepID=UPI003FD8C5EC